MNNYQRMRQTNSVVRKWLIENGYSDIIFFPHTRFQKDVYNWDMVCKKKLEGSSSLFRLWFGQVKTGYANKRTKKQLRDFCFNSSQNGFLFEYVFKDGKRNLKVTKFTGF